jgi:protein-S-isoprenylcysteine O-methyltransferase Ste14
MMHGYGMMGMGGWGFAHWLMFAAFVAVVAYPPRARPEAPRLLAALGGLGLRARRQHRWPLGGRAERRQGG